MKHSTTFRHGLTARLMLAGCLALSLAGVARAESPATLNAAPPTTRSLIRSLPGLPPSRAMVEKMRKYNREFDAFDAQLRETYAIIRERYIDEVEGKRLFESAVGGMLQSLDPHSTYFPPDAQAAFNRSMMGNFGGVGMQLALDKDRILMVLQPIPGGPAIKAGVRPWDRIIQIAGKTTWNMPISEAVRLMTGTKGTTVTIKIWREGGGQPLDFTLKRDTIKVASVHHKMLEGGIGYVRIAQFGEETAAGVRQALEEFNKNGARGVVIDVRYNSGGLLNRAVEICEMFLPKGKTIVSVKGRKAFDNQTFTASADPICTAPLAVLVNYLSASASEILAGAIKDNGRGVVIGPKGEHTYGKGTVQMIFPVRSSLEDDGSDGRMPATLHLTIARYYTPSGKPIVLAKGITPDVGVTLPDGHELELVRRGLLGDPDRRNPDLLLRLPPRDEIYKRPEPGPAMLGLDDPKTTTTAHGDASTTRTMEQILGEKEKEFKKAAANGAGKAGEAGKGTAGKEQEKAFRDLVLDEALKVLQERAKGKEEQKEKVKQAA